MEDLTIGRAGLADGDAIFALYHSLIDGPFSTWDEDYPTRELVEEDLRTQAVYVMRDGTGRIVSAIVLEKDEDFDGIVPQQNADFLDEDAPWHPAIVGDAWYPDVTRWAELGRLGVAADMQGRGIARRMLAHAMQEAKAEGREAVRFLVSRDNPIAQRAYAKLGFDICGAAESYGMTWLCYQKRL